MLLSSSISTALPMPSATTFVRLPPFMISFSRSASTYICGLQLVIITCKSAIYDKILVCIRRNNDDNDNDHDNNDCCCSAVAVVIIIVQSV